MPHYNYHFIISHHITFHIRQITIITYSSLLQIYFITIALHYNCLVGIYHFDISSPHYTYTIGLLHTKSYSQLYLRSYHGISTYIFILGWGL
jgi:hypothetical protein